MNTESVIQAVLHVVAQCLLIPVMIVLVLLMAFALVCIGSVIVEFFTERKRFNENSAADMSAIHDAPYDRLPEVVAQTKLLWPQKGALEIVVNNMGLPDDDLFALAKVEIAKVDAYYQRKLRRTELVTKVGPMLGLMCTLIPLGPGIVAIGSGDLNTLSESLLVAFDGTVAGLVAAVLAMLVTSIRRRWYDQYIDAVEALMASILSAADRAREEGVVLPHGFTEAELKTARKEGFSRLDVKRAELKRGDAYGAA